VYSVTERELNVSSPAIGDQSSHTETISSSRVAKACFFGYMASWLNLLKIDHPLQGSAQTLTATSALSTNS